MKRVQRRALLLTVLLALLLTSGPGAHSQSSPNFVLVRHAITSGGASSSAGFRVTGVFGQALASPTQLTSASFEVSAGYISADPGNLLFLPTLSDIE